jgi:methylated-DNA-[protein]-cysteine S-methyltransferase
MNFNQKVWNKCKEIPKGKISTYKQLAEAVGSPKAFRAVGNALNKNPYAPIVPCHRVISSVGHLHGFAFGLNKKKQMLEKEGLQIKNNKIVNFERFLYKF